ncbi:hypothetical protein SAMN05660485_02554 [Blastococcus fimeti]|nr:hypothetical protein SAMN05660485_02554 [Blastococcus fimeti]
MSRRDPQRARVLGLWTAGWLAVFLIAGMIRLGEPAVQWPVLAVPLVWALVALRPRRSVRDDTRDDGAWGADDDWPPEPPLPGHRTDTVERPAVRPPWE